MEAESRRRRARPRARVRLCVRFSETAIACVTGSEEDQKTVRGTVFPTNVRGGSRWRSRSYARAATCRASLSRGAQPRRPSWRIRHCRSELPADAPPVRAPLATARHGSSCWPTWGLRPFDALTRPHRGHGRVSLPQTVPPDSLPLRGPARTPARALDPDRVDKPAGDGEPRDQAAHRRRRVRRVRRENSAHAVFRSSSLPNDDAIVRLVGAIMLETNDEWTVARRYMSLETLARVNENPNLRLPAVAS